VEVPVNEPKTGSDGNRRAAPAYPGIFSVFDEAGLFANAHERTDVVKEVNKEKRKSISSSPNAGAAQV